jgi:hypothetical protein
VCQEMLDQSGKRTANRHAMSIDLGPEDDVQIRRRRENTDRTYSPPCSPANDNPHIVKSNCSATLFWRDVVTRCHCSSGGMYSRVPPVTVFKTVFQHHRVTDTLPARFDELSFVLAPICGSIGVAYLPSGNPAVPQVEQFLSGVEVPASLLRRDK